jgi:hypothetical protein
MADLKSIAKTLRAEQALACQRYATGNPEATYLAGLVSDGSQMNKQPLQAWAEGAAGMPPISEYTVPWVTVENPQAWELAREWVKSKKASVAFSCELISLPH